jgi:hypothetical protein
MAKTHMLQLDPTIPVVTADGEGEAIGWLDYGKDDDLMWIVFLKENGECWIYPNSKVRAVPNITFGRMPHTSPRALAESLKSPPPHPPPAASPPPQ